MHARPSVTRRSRETRETRSAAREEKRVEYNGTETMMVKLLSYLLGSYVSHLLHTARHGLARISNDERVLHIVSHDEMSTACIMIIYRFSQG